MRVREVWAGLVLLLGGYALGLAVANGDVVALVIAAAAAGLGLANLALVVERAFHEGSADVLRRSSGPPSVAAALSADPNERSRPSELP